MLSLFWGEGNGGCYFFFPFFYICGIFPSKMLIKMINIYKFQIKGHVDLYNSYRQVNQHNSYDSGSCMPFEWQVVPLYILKY